MTMAHGSEQVPGAGSVLRASCIQSSAQPSQVAICPGSHEKPLLPYTVLGAPLLDAFPQLKRRGDSSSQLKRAPHCLCGTLCLGPFQGRLCQVNQQCPHPALIHQVHSLLPTVIPPSKEGLSHWSLE